MKYRKLGRKEHAWEWSNAQTYCIWLLYIIRIMHKYREASINLTPQSATCTSSIKRGASSIGYISQVLSISFYRTGNTIGITCLDVHFIKLIPIRQTRVTMPTIKGNREECNIDGLTSRIRSQYRIGMKLGKTQVCKICYKLEVV